MGRWTLSYYDDVLGAKIKGLVDGAIKRAKLEKTEPTITYELFVEELDAGDSFTTSLIDILVKEMAERRTRPTSADRRLIADRSAKSLRMLATPLRIYRERSGGHGALARRNVNLTEYLTAPPDEMEMEEDEDEYENALGNAMSAVEGARLNSEMYDAFGGFPHRWSSHSGFATSRRAQADVSAVTSTDSDDTQVADPLPSSTVYSTSPSNRTSPLSFPSPSNSSLFRPTTIRRPVRSRTVDFNDFTSRRRSSVRQGTTQEGPVPTEDLPRSISTWDNPAVLSSSATSRSPQSARRFFGLSRNRRHDSTDGVLFRDMSLPSASASAPDDLSYWTIDANSAGPWFSSRQPYFSTRYQAPESEGDEERAQDELPRLRRGGVRAPESILSRNISPSPEGDRGSISAPTVTFSAPSLPEGATENLAGAA